MFFFQWNSNGKIEEVFTNANDWRIYIHSFFILISDCISQDWIFYFDNEPLIDLKNERYDQTNERTRYFESVYVIPNLYYTNTTLFFTMRSSKII
jgi:hypothetical protein